MKKTFLQEQGLTKINLIDVGSSFNLFEPFNYIENVWEENLHILCFEPNEETNISNSKATKINITNVLWNDETQIKFHIAKEKASLQSILQI